jgi:hypothetical protein
MMDARINNVIEMEHHSGRKMANGACGKMIIAGMIDPGSTVHAGQETQTGTCIWRQMEKT